MKADAPTSNEKQPERRNKISPARSAGNAEQTIRVPFRDDTCCVPQQFENKLPIFCHSEARFLCEESAIGRQLCDAVQESRVQFLPMPKIFKSPWIGAIRLHSIHCMGGILANRATARNYQR